jgi:DNA-binding MarR family transcriptional regulator
MDRDEMGTDLYLAMRGTWLRFIPDSLEKEDPDRLLRFMKLAEPSEGISQSAMRKALNLHQSHMSKLKDRLVAANWVEVWKPASNPRLLLMRSTPTAKRSLARIRREMSHICAMTS